jgi:hypothetical protein
MVKTYLAFCHMEVVCNVVAVDKDNSRRLSYANWAQSRSQFFANNTKILKAIEEI